MLGQLSWGGLLKIVGKGFALDALRRYRQGRGLKP